MALSSITSSLNGIRHDLAGIVLSDKVKGSHLARGAALRERAAHAGMWLRRLGIDPKSVTAQNFNKPETLPLPTPNPAAVDSKMNVLHMGWGISAYFEGASLSPPPSHPPQRLPLFLPGKRVIIPGRLDQGIHIHIKNLDILQGVQIYFNGINVFSGKSNTPSKALSRSPLNYHTLERDDVYLAQSWKAGKDEHYRLVPVSNGRGILAFGRLVFFMSKPEDLIQTPEYRQVIDALIADVNPNLWREAPDVNRSLHTFPLGAAAAREIDAKLTQTIQSPEGLIEHFGKTDPRQNITVRGYPALQVSKDPSSQGPLSDTGSYEISFYVVDPDFLKPWLPVAPPTLSGAAAPAKPQEAQPDAIPGMKNLNFSPYGDVGDEEKDPWAHHDFGD